MGASNMPSVNQMETQPWWHEDDLAELHKSLGIVGNSYSPLGTPDVRTNWNVNIHNDTTLTKVSLRLLWLSESARSWFRSSDDTADALLVRP